MRDGKGVPDTGFVVEFISDKASYDDRNGVDSAGREVVRPELVRGEIAQDLVVDADEMAQRVLVGKRGGTRCGGGARGSQGMVSNSHEALREFDVRHRGRTKEEEGSCSEWGWGKNRATGFISFLYLRHPGNGPSLLVCRDVDQRSSAGPCIHRLGWCLVTPAAIPQTRNRPAARINSWSFACRHKFEVCGWAMNRGQGFTVRHNQHLPAVSRKECTLVVSSSYIILAYPQYPHNLALHLPHTPNNTKRRLLYIWRCTMKAGAMQGNATRTENIQ